MFVFLGDNAVLADDVAATQGPTLSAGPTPGRQLCTSGSPSRSQRMTLSVTAVGYGKSHTSNQI